jgi:tetratricopeptide (TPR) repeat protein
MLRSRLTLTAFLMMGTAFAAITPSPAGQPVPRANELQGSALCLALGQPFGLSTEPPARLAGLGARSWKITTASAEAQGWFDQGVALAWGFNHAEAWRAFARALALDPGCAMCAWGAAWVLGPNVNDVMHPEAVEPARIALARAVALAPSASPVEQALIAALASRYPGDGAAAMSDEAAWADALAGVAARFPDDPVILSLHAEAMMNTQPWDYWEAGGTAPKGRAGAIVAALEQALAIDPDHPAAIHLYIHTVEASTTPERAEPFADRLRGQMPAAGHLVHMPGHIYLRVGRHADAIAVNVDAVASDEAFFALAGEAAGPVYRFGYYPHNVHFLLTAAQFSGRADLALPAAARLGALIPDEMAAAVPLAQPVKTALYTAHAQLAAKADVLALPAPGEDLPFIRAFWHYARGVALARAGEGAAAEAERAAIARILAEADLAPLEAALIPARAMLTVAERVLAARIAQAKGDLAAAEAALREALAAEAGIGYMEPAYWYYPVSQTLGAVLLAQGRAAEAEAAFAAALAKQRRSGWALWGLMQAQEAQGRAVEAAATRAAFDAVWTGDRALLRLELL